MTGQNNISKIFTRPTFLAFFYSAGTGAYTRFPRDYWLQMYCCVATSQKVIKVIT